MDIGHGDLMAWLQDKQAMYLFLAFPSVFGQVAKQGSVWFSKCRLIMKKWF